jgi:predicted nucleic acid-binding protein
MEASNTEVCMPQYRIEGNVLDIARNALLLDTNVLVAAFSPEEKPGNKEYAKNLLDSDNSSLLISNIVIVEAWGVLVAGKSARYPLGHELLTWLNLPGRATLVYAHQADMQSTEHIVRRIRVDCVDAMLAELATIITNACGLSPSLPIATFDTKDFFQLSKIQRLRFSLVDMRSPKEIVEFKS